MSHLRCPATAWRIARLRVAPVDEFGKPAGTAGYVTCAGAYADENATVVTTSAIRSVAEGRRPEGLTIGAGTAQAYLVTLEDAVDAVGAGMSMASAAIPAPIPRAPSRPTGQATMDREIAATAAEQYDILIQTAEIEERRITAHIEGHLDRVEEFRADLRAARNHTSELRHTRKQLLASIGAEA